MTRVTLPRNATLASLLLAWTLSAASAEIYRWVDTAGEVHYSQVPPAGTRAWCHGSQRRYLTLETLNEVTDNASVKLSAIAA